MGQLKDEEYEGRGILYSDYTYDGYFRVYKNSSKLLKYEGFYKMDELHGKGILYNENGKKLFDGNFNNEKYEGIGIEYFYKGILKRKMVYNQGEPLKECFGEYYDENNNLIYQGLLKNLRPENARDVTIYEKYKNIVYIGGFINYEYNSKGILYYENSDKKYFEGLLEEGKFIKGTLYDPEGNKIYEGEFNNNNPKECKNITLYDLNKKIIFIGDLSEGKYNGYGKIYQDNNLIYEGNFKDDIYEGKGVLYIDEISKYEGTFKEGKYHNQGKIFKDQYIYFEGEYLNGKRYGKGTIYYQNKLKYFEGNFENDEKKGEGIRYYDNGNIKIKAIYINSSSCKGKYYSPDNEFLYEGEMIEEIPCNENIRIYNDYTYKMYTLEKKEKNEEIYSIISSEYFPNYYMSERLKLQLRFKIPFLSFNTITGKTALLHKLVFNIFTEEFMGPVIADRFLYEFEKNNKKFKGYFYDLSSLERFQSLIFNYAKNCNIAIFTINIFENKEINELYIDKIKEIMDEKYIFYMVGNKFEYLFNQSNLERNRNKIKELIKKGIIYKYFEVDAKTGQGIENSIKNIEFDIIGFSK